jgi:hypothetical protein
MPPPTAKAELPSNFPLSPRAHEVSPDYELAMPIFAQFSPPPFVP